MGRFLILGTVPSELKHFISGYETVAGRRVAVFDVSYNFLQLARQDQDGSCFQLFWEDAVYFLDPRPNNLHVIASR